VNRGLVYAGERGIVTHPGLGSHFWASVTSFDCRSEESMVDEEMNVRLGDGRAVGFIVIW